MKFLLKENLVGLDKKETDQSLGKYLGQIMAQDSSSDPLKLAEWAMALYNQEELDLDRSDQKIFEDFVKNTKQLSNLAKYQILEIFDEAKEKSKKK